MKIIETIKPGGLRYICINEETGEILDDAQGYGYKSRQKAYSGFNYKYGNGKLKHSENKAFWKKHKDIAIFIAEYQEYNFKEFMRGEITGDDLIEEIKTEFGISISMAQLKHYDLAFKK